MKVFRYVLAAFLVQMVSSLALAANLLVPGSYATIQGAVDAAANTGDEVHVTVAATYDEYVIVSGSKDLKIVGDVAGVIVASIGLNDSAQLTLDNITVTNKTARNNGDGVNQRSTGLLTLTNSAVSGCNLRGLVHESGGNIIMTNSSLTGNSFDGYDRTGSSGGGLTASGGCVIANNNRAGLMFEGGDTMTANISDTEIRGNNIGIYVAGSTNLSIAINSSLLLNNKQDQMLLAKQVQLTMDNVTLQHTSSPSFAGGIRFDSGAGTATSSSVVASNCQFLCPYNKNCFWVFHPVSINAVNCVFSGFSCAFEVNEQVAVDLTSCTVANTFNVPVSINGYDGDPVRTFTANRCRLTGGSAPFNLLNAVATEARLTNCVFEGGDVQVWSQGDQSMFDARNCTFAGDVITTAAMFIRRDNTLSLLANCIIDNTYNGVSGDTGVTLNNHNNMVRALNQNFVGITPGGSTILDTNPQFVQASSGPGTGNFHLKPISPAIGAGDNTLGVTVDYDNIPRGATNDMGAYKGPVSDVRDWVIY
ncbi:MAG: right-handed parallel beta-helix repeat-containing protein [bacterium]|nr:right-handed parallel beta-helix repeat-containing protein [Candidatus Sumerlaeota bacterium]